MHNTISFKNDTKSRAIILSGNNYQKQIELAQKFIKDILHNSANETTNLIWIDTKSTSSVIDVIKGLNTFVSKTTYNNLPKIIVIDTIDDLNVYASNALLKLLEEPVSHTYFILLSHNVSLVLKTIRSRCISLKSDLSLDKQYDNQLYRSFIYALDAFKTDAIKMYSFIEEVYNKKDDTVLWDSFKLIVQEFIISLSRFKLSSYEIMFEEERKVIEQICRLKSVDELVELYDYTIKLLYNTDTLNLNKSHTALIIVSRLISNI